MNSPPASNENFCLVAEQRLTFGGRAVEVCGVWSQTSDIVFEATALVTMSVSRESKGSGKKVLSGGKPVIKFEINIPVVPTI